MKVLVATDGSSCSQVAIDLVAGLPWPEGTLLRLLSVVDVIRLAGPYASLAPVDLGSLETGLSEEMSGLLEGAGKALEREGRTVERRVARGRAPEAIVTEAREMGADVICVGSRGRGPMRSLLLGSVSAEVVDRASCPVLICRHRELGPILLAHDGSDQARAAEDLLAKWPIFAGLPVEVLSVATGRHTEDVPAALTGAGWAVDVYRTALEASRRHHEDIARGASERLARLGHTTTWEVRSGDPASLIVDEASQRSTGVVVMGTHGRTGLDRLFLGSVARNVLSHAHCSVIVVPPKRAA